MPLLYAIKLIIGLQLNILTATCANENLLNGKVLSVKLKNPSLRTDAQHAIENLLFPIRKHGKSKRVCKLLVGTVFWAGVEQEEGGDYEVRRNASGFVETVEGYEFDILLWLSKRLNFKYEFWQTNESTAERSSDNVHGKFGYYCLNSKECDMLLHPVILTFNHSKQYDMTYPFGQSAMGFLIPITDNSFANTTAVLKPFQWPVWLLVFLSILCVAITLMYLNSRDSFSKPKAIRPTNVEQSVAVKAEINQNYLHNPYVYTFGILLSQGGQCTSKRVLVRLVAGAWCMAAFVLVNAYSSLLITYVLAPNNPPIINSVFDIVNNPEIHLVVPKGWAIDDIISTSNDEGGSVFKKLREKLDTYPKSRCSLSDKCIDLVKSRQSVDIYSNAIEYLKYIINVDFKKTGHCNLQIAKEKFFQILVGFALAKRSPYTDAMSRGLMEFMEYGLTKRITDEYPVPQQCIDKANNKQSSKIRISLKHISGAFIVLLFGCFLSFFTFIGEKFIRIIIHGCSSAGDYVV